MRMIVWAGLSLGCVASFAAAGEIHFAADQGDLKSVKQLLSEDPKLADAPNKDGLTPLYLAARRGHLKVAEHLIEQKAGVNLLASGDGPLHVAAEENQAEMIRLLLKHGAEIDLRNAAKDTPLHMACWEGAAESAVLLLKNKADLEAADENDDRPLHLACAGGHEETVKALLAAGAKIDVVNRQGYTPLHLPAKNGSVPVIKALLATKIPVDAKAANGFTALHAAASSGQAEAVALLLPRSDPNLLTNQGMTPLYLAAFLGLDRVVEVLLTDNRVDVAAADADQSTPLHAAANGGSAEVTQRLLDRKAKVNATDKAGDSPLHVAAARGRVAVARVLLKNGADPQLKAKDGKTSLDRAQAFAQDKIISLLEGKDDQE
ncbi:MAG: ankyrin repeat domain-containing protein [Planctomycetales bacterium]